MKNDVQQYLNLSSNLTWCACTIPKVTKTRLFVTKTHNLGTQYYIFLISHSQHKRNGIETQIVAINDNNMVIGSYIFMQQIMFAVI